MRPPRLGTLFALAACLILVPTTALALPKIGQKHNGYSLTDERYLHVYVDCWHAFKGRCGRNLIDDQMANGKEPSTARVERSISTMQRWLHPAPAPEPIDASSVSTDPAPVTSTVAPTSGAMPPESIAACESGGSYTAVNPSSGAYGKWQILPSTSAAYGCDMSTPEGQDACAAEIWDGGAGASQWSCAG